MSTTRTNNTVSGLFNPQVSQKLVLSPFKVPPFPEKLLKIVPEMKQYEQELQIAIDRQRIQDANAIKGFVI